jgi:hypothetical protein
MSYATEPIFGISGILLQTAAGPLPGGVVHLARRHARRRPSFASRCRVWPALPVASAGMASAALQGR